MDWPKIFIDFEDILVPHYGFDIYQRGMYLYLLNQTRVRGLGSSTLSLAAISGALNCSVWQTRKVIRQLAEMKCIELEQTRNGHAFKVLLPEELNIQATDSIDKALNIEEIDFFQGRKYLLPLLRREGNKCFFCLTNISQETSELDHVIPQVKGGSNSYRNIVATCHKCNTRKQASDAVDYLRTVYRQGFLSESEFEERLITLDGLRNGELQPQI